jgi:hypothetical protein
VGAATIIKCKVIMDAIFGTAVNDEVTPTHPGKGVKTPVATREPIAIISPAEFDCIYRSVKDEVMQLLVETDIESGARWGELTELRAKDLDQTTGMLRIRRAVVHLKAKNRPGGQRFVIKHYPKDGEPPRHQAGPTYEGQIGPVHHDSRTRAG